MTFKTFPTHALLYVTEQEREQLIQLRAAAPDKWGTTEAEVEALEHFCANSEWDWAAPAETGDLTDAPMLASRDDQGRICERYAFMNYQVRSFLSDLIDEGVARWEGGRL